MTRFTTLTVAVALAALPVTARAQRDRDRDRDRDREVTRIDSTFSFGKDGMVDVELVSGEITITGWARSEAKVHASTEEGSIDASLSTSRIRLSQNHSGRGRSGETRYEITVPVGTRVRANSVSGSIHITGTNGEVEAEAVNGAVEVIGANDRISLQTVNGRLHAAKLRGRVKLGNVNSTIEAEDIVGDLTASTVSGRITLSNVTSSHVNAEAVSGNLTYQGSIDPAGAYEFSTHSGNVHMEIPENSAADLQLETFSGRISSAFPITLQPGDLSSMGRRGKKTDFVIGKGGARVTASTFSGNIIIEKAGHTTREEN